MPSTVDFGSDELVKRLQRSGQMKHAKVLDQFFGHVQLNTTGFCQEAFPFISLRTHEHYFVRWARPPHSAPGGLRRSRLEAPIVFNDLRDGELRYLPPGGASDAAASVSTPFEPSSLRLTEDGRLLHPVWTTGRTSPGASTRRERMRLLACLEATTAQAVLDLCEEAEEHAEDSPLGLSVRWKGKLTPLLTLEPES
eukprot:TRINITY_DN19053_c0_g1_i1.p1 TRINITY_DN19053_c0_g1~~TRINITY_DN19053_c0_g1_i1.p1  ORF type:complete len:196 (-),score=47.09 TRINITY_DN19053_c0_g1_i1:23-610(-)